MSLEAIKHGRELRARVRAPSSTPEPGPGRVGLRQADGCFFIEQDSGLHELQVHGNEDLRALRLIVDNPDRCVVELRRVGSGQLLVEARLVRELVRLARPLVVVFPDEVLERVPQRERRDLQDFFEGELGWSGHFFARGEPDQAVRLHEPFQLLGGRHSVQVRPEGDRFVAVHLRRARPWQAPTVLRGELRFLEARDAGVDAAVARILAVGDGDDGDGVTEAAETLSQARNVGAFLRDWSAYQQAEAELVEATARRLGELPYSSWTHATDKRLRFILGQELPAAWREGDVRVSLEARGDTGSVRLGSLVVPEGRGGSALEVAWDGEETPPDRGKLAVDLTGDRKRLGRQATALRQVKERRTELPDLLEVLDGNGRTQVIGPTLKPLSAKVRRQLGHPPTDAQTRAIANALNTPDISLVQGPPGTGKTTVIQAVAQRLHEAGRLPVLLTSYQHEAVKRVIEGVTVGELPVVRVGGKRGEDRAEAVAYLLEWIEGLVVASTEGLEGLPEDPWAELRRQAWKQVSAWEVQPGGVEGTVAMVRSLRRLVGTRVGAELVGRLDALEVELGTPPVRVDALDEAVVQELAGLLRGQRLDPVAWSDDGPERLRKLYRFVRPRRGLHPLIEAVHDELFEAQRSASWEGPVPSELPALLDRLRPLTEPPAPVPEAELPLRRARPVVNAVLDRLETGAKAGPEGVADALLRFRELLRRDPGIARQVLGRYAPALGATVQQAVGSDMRDLHTAFDTVIVDEAARANPLDLLIPMVLARRIVMVGDQNQLPHMLEPRLEKALEEGRLGDVGTTLRQSLFGVLWDRYRHAPPGGIVRTELLDVQFRMHPELGTFVSDTFYGGALKNGVEAGDRPLPPGLPVDGPMAWFDVPRSEGREVRSGKSLLRQVEVERVVHLLRGVLSEAGNLERSVAVISFYGAQVEAIREAVDEHGWGARVSVGTVDAFQGREFDVVLLSTVRSNRHREARKAVGFLWLPNRLNVAMSRARCFLGVVGDRATVRKVESLDALALHCEQRGTLC